MEKLVSKIFKMFYKLVREKIKPREKWTRDMAIQITEKILINE